MDRLRCVGNAIVPQVAEVLFRAINDAEAVRAAA
jgi:site-specific DNA-cytosine methylase